MSDYRDDSHDIAIISDRTWGGQKGLAGAHARIADRVFYRLGEVLADTAHLTDAVQDRSLGGLVDSAHLTDAVIGHLSASVALSDDAKIGARVRERLQVTLGDSAVLSDAVTDWLAHLSRDAAHLADAVSGQRTARTLVEDAAQLQGLVINLAVTLVDESVGIADACLDRLQARILLADALTVTDGVVDGGSAQAIASDAARAAATYVDALRAKQIIIDSAELLDRLLHDDGFESQAWTANTSTWAMSRYQPYSFTSVAVIGGLIYATGKDGVYALSGGDETIAAHLRTGKLDLGGEEGVLVHPLGALVEYELDGEASLRVRQTQSGSSEEVYDYPLPSKPAEVLTNGRFLFGRGLRGRHFAFDLTLQGRRALINDLRLEVAPTKRRV